MGNCLELRKNKVGAVDNITAKERTRGSRKYTKSLKDGERRMVQELRDQQPSVRGAGVSFVVDLDRKITTKPPRRLQKLERKPSLALTIEQLDEKQLKADLLRQERKANIQLKARQEQERYQSVMRRREAMSGEIKAKVEAKQMEHEKNVEERKRKLTELAQKTKEAKKKKTNTAV